MNKQSLNQSAVLFVFLTLLLALVAPAFADPPEQCINKSASSTNQTATFSFKGCPVVFNFSDKLAYASFYGMPATVNSSPVPAASSATQPGAFGPCVIQVSTVNVIMAGSDTGALRICNYGGTQ